ncbi:MAG: sigma-70 family RNA polymerase sigma factor [Bradymonadaceae bacterium]|nr:sigma-70 family RNA polymerase sigma factor [Lujinxingiaceae bacterium]
MASSLAIEFQSRDLVLKPAAPLDSVNCDLMYTQVPGEHASNASIDALTSYMNRLRCITLLSVEEQQELAERYLKGDVEAGQMLVWTNLRLVVKIAREYARRWSDLLDLIQEGNLGLTEALSRYNPHRGVKFTGYAQFWVRAMMLNHLMNQLHSVRLGGSRAGRKLFYNLKKARRALLKEGLEPTPALVAQYLDVDVEDVVHVSAQLDGKTVYLDGPVPGMDGVSIGDQFAGEQENPEEVATRSHCLDKLRVMMEEFARGLADERKRAIWQDRMVQGEPKQLADLGLEFQVSKERIRQIELEVRDDFKFFLHDKLGHEMNDFLECI